jgi:hypothetical protein
MKRMEGGMGTVMRETYREVGIYYNMKQILENYLINIGTFLILLILVGKL